MVVVWLNILRAGGDSGPEGRASNDGVMAKVVRRVCERQAEPVMHARQIVTSSEAQRFDFPASIWRCDHEEGLSI